ncbi:MAG: NRDE family protein [Anditalea sp.]
MCLISFNWLDHPVYKLSLVANRDEFFDRPTSSLHLWPTGFYAGKDIKGGGTWMGFHPKGKFAALTNYRNLHSRKENPISRGNLVKGFLENEENPFEYLSRIQKKMDRYDGFNLLVANGEEMGYLCNYRQGVEKVSPGVHGISNAFLDTPWPKVEMAKSDLQDLIAKDEINVDALMELVQSRSYAPDERLPKTGISYEMERILSAQFIRKGDEYGTVSTSVVLWKHDGNVVIKEKVTMPLEEVQKQFRIIHPA